jgi:chaperonin GroEL
VARRIIELPARGDGPGAMLLRHAIWRMHDEVGDGGAMTAVLTQAILADGVRLIRAGFDSTGLRNGLQLAATATGMALRMQSRPAAVEPLLISAFGRGDLTTQLARLCADLGPDGYVDIREDVASSTSYRTIPGGRWSASVFTPSLAGRGELVLTDPYVLVTDRDITDSRDIAGILDAVLGEDGGPLVIVAKNVTGSALRVLQANRQALPVAACGLSAETHWRDHLEDLAYCTRARFVSEQWGACPASARIDDLGYAQHIRLRADTIEVLGGAGDIEECTIRRHALRRALEHETEEAERDTLRRRIGNLAGRTAVLRLAAMPDMERAAARVTAERAVRLAVAAAAEGTVPGGGAALVHCRNSLDALRHADPAVCLGIRLLRDALAAPLRRIARDRPGVVDHVQEAGAPNGYDASTDQIADLRERGILDSTAVLCRAVETAVSTAGSALTAAALVLGKTPELSLIP